MLRNYAKRAVSVRYNSTTPPAAGGTDIDSLLERVKNLTKNVSNHNNAHLTGSKNQNYRNNNRGHYQTGAKGSGQPRNDGFKREGREGGFRNNNYNRQDRNNDNRSGRSQDDFRSGRPQRDNRFVRGGNTKGAPLSVGINAKPSVTKKTAGANIDSSIGDFMAGLDVPVDTAAASTTATSQTRPKLEFTRSPRDEGQSRPDRYNNRPRRDFNEREGGFRRDERPGFARGGNREGGFRSSNRGGFDRQSKFAPGLRSRYGKDSRGGKRDNKRSKNQGPRGVFNQGPTITIKKQSNIELLSSKYSPEVPTSNSLLATSPLLSNDTNSRILRAIRSAVEDSNVDFGAVLKGDLREVNVEQYSKQLKTENLKFNAKIVANALNKNGSLDIATKMRILGPLIGTAPVKELPLKYKELQQ